MSEMLSHLHQLSEDKQKLFEQHLDLVIDANERVNLTRIVSRESAKLLHIEDSLCALPEMDQAPQGRYGDLGSGAGYPGIPLAIATGRQTLLIDSRMKKMEVIGGIIEKLGCDDLIETFAGRAELLARRHPASFSVLTARALSKLNVLEELASPLLKQGGHLICYKSNVTDEELNDAMRVQKLTGMKLVSDRSFVLANEYDRRIIVFERIGKPQVKLPRQEGAAQKTPL